LFSSPGNKVSAYPVRHKKLVILNTSTMNGFFGNKNLRSLHRDCGYFFVGLIIAFSVSGIMLNHKSVWNPARYQYDFKTVQSNFHLPKTSVTLDSVKSFNKQNKIKDFNDFNFRDDSTLVIFYKMTDVTVHLENGRGEINFWRQRPISFQLVSLHLSLFGNNWYMWYTDLFALGLIFIATTGMSLMRGKNSFRKRGWLFGLAGIIIPIIALFLGS
jgi:hypothetical protein